MQKSMLLISTFIISALLLSSSVLAGSGSISASPSSGTYTVNQEFDVTVRASANASFNTFSASVGVSNLTVLSLSKNGSISNCNPSAGNPSFSGCALLGSTTTSINVYTMRVRVTSAGTTRINLSGCGIWGIENDIPGQPFSTSCGGASFTVNVPPTSAPRPTSRPASTALPTATTDPSITIEPTSTPTPTLVPTLTREQLTVIQISGPDSLPLINSEVFIDGVSYYTDNTGNIEIPGLYEGTHEVKYFVDGDEYNQSFVLGAYAGGKDILLKFTDTTQNSGDFPIIYVMGIAAILILLNNTIWYFVYKKR